MKQLYRAEARFEHHEDTPGSLLEPRHPTGARLPVDSVPSMEIRSSPGSKVSWSFTKKNKSCPPLLIYKYLIIAFIFYRADCPSWSISLSSSRSTYGRFTVNKLTDDNLAIALLKRTTFIHQNTPSSFSLWQYYVN